MSFFTNLFHGVRAKSTVFIDINADSVAGAYAQYREGEQPTLLYTRRLPIEIRKGEPHERAMLRALEILGSTLIREGAPSLVRAIGHGRADRIFVSIDAPWQHTSVRTERLQQKTPFVFTKNMVTSVMEKTRTASSGKFLADESITGTILNGYEIRSPYGKKAHSAEMLILTSFINAQVASEIRTLLQKLYHAEHISFIAGNSLRCQMMLKVFPHEHDVLILDAVGSIASIALVRKGLLVAVIEASNTLGAGSWAERIGSELTELAQHYPLPRTIFLLARESDITSLRGKIDASTLGKLWLSDNPPNIVAVSTSHIAGLIRQTAVAPPDLQLLLMALFEQNSPFEERFVTHRSSYLPRL